MQTKSSVSSSLALALVASSLLGGVSRATASDNAGLYLDTDLGLNLMGDVKAENGRISADPGIRWSLATGYRYSLNPQFTLAGELETGLLYNPLRNASAAAGGSAPVGGSYVQVPLLANVVLTYHGDRWEPYAGAGAGLSYSVISVDSVGNNQVGALGGEIDPAWQIMAGVRYRLSERTSVGLGYKFLSVSPAGLGAVQNQSVGASVTFKF